MTSSTAKSFGYIRVSTAAQNLDRQIDALTKTNNNGPGLDPSNIFSDKISGTKTSRPGLDDLLSRVRPGDSVTVVSFDRLGRSALHVMETIAMLEGQGVEVRSLKGGEANMSGATGALMRAILVHVAQWERDMNTERVAEARAARASRAKEGEQVAGRPRTALSPANVALVQKLRAEGKGVAAIVTETGIPRSSVYRALSA